MIACPEGKQTKSGLISVLWIRTIFVQPRATFQIFRRTVLWAYIKYVLTFFNKKFLLKHAPRTLVF
jgi:hypothetical protein